MDKELVKEITNHAKKYENAHKQTKELEQVKKKARTEAGIILKELQVPEILVDHAQGKALKVQEVIRKTAKYDDDKMMKLLKSKGKNVFKRAVVLSINHDVLDELFNEGVLSFDEINECLDKIVESSMIDIRRVKAEIK